MRYYVMAAAFLACSAFAKTDCRPPPEGEEVSDLYYQLCPKKTPPPDEEENNTTTAEAENPQESLKDMSKRKTMSNPFLKYPKKDKFYTRPTQNKPWWEQDGQYTPSPKETSS